jgi:hypothetical protein
MPRHLQSELHSSFSKSVPNWQYFRDSIKRLFDASSTTRRADFNNHVVREHNRKIKRLNLPINLLIPNCDSSGRLKSNAIDAIEKTLKTANSTSDSFYFATYDATTASARSLSFSTSSGYWRMIYENGTYGTVTANNVSHATAIPAGSGYRVFGVMICDINGNPAAGYEFNVGITITNCNLVYFSYDVNLDGDLINLSNNLLTNLDLTSLNALDGLSYVNLSNNLLSYLKLNKTYNYNSITLGYNKFTSFDGSGISLSGSLDLSNNPLSSIVVNGLSVGDDALNLSSTNLTSFDSTGFTGSLVIGNCANLTSVKLIGTSGYACYINNNSNLISFTANGGGFNEFSIASNNLKTVSISSFGADLANFGFNSLTSFVTSNFSVTELNLSHNLLTYINSNVGEFAVLDYNRFNSFANIIISTPYGLDLSNNLFTSVSGAGSMGTLGLNVTLNLSNNLLTTFAPTNWYTPTLYLDDNYLVSYDGGGVKWYQDGIIISARNNQLSTASIDSMVSAAINGLGNDGTMYLDGGTNSAPGISFGPLGDRGWTITNNEQ